MEQGRWAQTLVPPRTRPVSLAQQSWKGKCVFMGLLGLPGRGPQKTCGVSGEGGNATELAPSWAPGLQVGYMVSAVRELTVLGQQSLTAG